MNILTSIKPSINGNEFPIIQLDIPGEKVPCFIKTDLHKLWGIGTPASPILFDLLMLATVVYSLDRRVPRKYARDNWTRHFSFSLPVSKPSIWKEVKIPLEKCLSFLSGDVWEITFSSLNSTIRIPIIPNPSLPFHYGAVSLFSGGLDSLIGTIDWLESHPQESIILVGHHDPKMAGPLSDQELVSDHLQDFYNGRFQTSFVMVGSNMGGDTTLRSRSFLFMALGLYASNALSENTPLLVPENGTIALNVPLTPSRIGSCSTRTTHPYYLSLLRAVLLGLNINNPIITPLESKTKGECVSECLNQEVLRETYSYTASCAKRGHKSIWNRRNVKECGRCMPCIYRRAALHVAGLDNQSYGKDICTGEVDPNSGQLHAEDLQACLSFLHHNQNKSDIGKLLFLNGKVDITKLDYYGGIILRAMDEIRILLRDKASPEIKRLAGL